MHIFFDIDGVLMNNIHMVHGWIDRWDKTMKEDLGLDPLHLQEIFKGWFPKVQTGHLDFEEEMDRWLKYHDYDLKAWQVINYWHEKDTNVSKPVFDVVEKLSKQDGIHVYTATNQTHARIAYLRDVLGWKDYFEDFYYSARLGCLKHDPNYFAQIEEELGFDPYIEQPLYFDDDPKNIEVATARGWNAVLFDTADDCTNHPIITELLQRSV